jgi:hypothetical protein
MEMSLRRVFFLEKQSRQQVEMLRHISLHSMQGRTARNDMVEWGERGSNPHDISTGGF